MAGLGGIGPSSANETEWRAGATIGGSERRSRGLRQDSAYSRPSVRRLAEGRMVVRRGAWYGRLPGIARVGMSPPTWVCVPCRGTGAVLPAAGARAGRAWAPVARNAWVTGRRGLECSLRLDVGATGLGRGTELGDGHDVQVYLLRRKARRQLVQQEPNQALCRVRLRAVRLLRRRARRQLVQQESNRTLRGHRAGALRLLRQQARRELVQQEPDQTLRCR